MRWINSNKKVPDNNREVLVYAPNCNILGSILIGQYFEAEPEKNYPGSWKVYDFGESKLDELVTHWMELPELP